MQCVSCKRSDSSRRFYCPSCVSNRCVALSPARALRADSIRAHRLGDHHSRRHLSRSGLELVQAKALSLLTPPAASPVLGVREESELKALKFSLATRLRDVRLAATKARDDMAAGEPRTCCGATSHGHGHGYAELTPFPDRTELDRRRENLQKRRANLDRKSVV